jgi:hypothetical protein
VDHAVGQAERAPVVADEQDAEGVLVPPLAPGHQLAIVVGVVTRYGISGDRRGALALIHRAAA